MEEFEKKFLEQKIKKIREEYKLPKSLSMMYQISSFIVFLTSILVFSHSLTFIRWNEFRLMENTFNDHAGLLTLGLGLLSANFAMMALFHQNRLLMEKLENLHTELKSMQSL